MNLQKATCISSRALFPNMPKVGKTYFIDADTICSVEGQNFVDVYIQTDDKMKVYDYVGFFVLEHFALDVKEEGAPYHLRDLLDDMDWTKQFYTDVALFASDWIKDMDK